MDREPELKSVRRAFAKHVTAAGGVRDPRDEVSQQAPAGFFDQGSAEHVTWLSRRRDLPRDQCWLRAPGWCLAYH